MSCVYKGKVIQSELSKNAKGGTEMMRDRLIEYVNPDLLNKVAIHFSRPREIYEDVPNILYCHDLAEDPENVILAEGGWRKFAHFVFVSCWQRDQYVRLFGIPYSHCTVIYNAIDKDFSDRKFETVDEIKFIYHTTPHRGLELLIPIFEELCKTHNNITLDVYSSFSIYGWEQRDDKFKDCFDRIKSHPKMNYHGAVSNEKVLEALENSHVFLYPNIWKETSCIALIEAIKSQLVCIHPDFGALPETSSGNTIMYRYNENIQEHANQAYAVTNYLLNTIKSDPNYLTNHAKMMGKNKLDRNGINAYATLWDSLLSNVLAGK